MTAVEARGACKNCGADAAMEEKRYADYIIENDTTEAELHLRVDELIGTLQKMRRKIMHSRPARHKTLPPETKMHMGAENMAKKLQKEKYTQKYRQSEERRQKQALDHFCGLLYCACACGRSCVPKPVRRHFSYPMEYEAEVRRACEKYDLDPCLVFAVIRTESFLLRMPYRVRAHRD